MNNRNDILNELREISPLIAGMEKINLFTVPAGYFNEVPGNMLTLVKQEENSLLLAQKKQPAMNIPAGYFDSLAGNIMDKIKALETTEDYPLLNTISKANVYTVPQGYFETVSTEVLNKINQPQPKVVGMGSKTGWFKYAAAAVFTGIITLGIYKMTVTPVSQTAALPAYVKEGQQIKNVDEELAKVTDEDIIKYLQADGTDVDAALVANAVDENELPSKEDYLTDDKALDKYLDNIDLTDLKN